ncbi:scyllo-inositol 2-dehydrogenase (NADP(+)) [Pontiella desulfatans]|uniref:Scyllo-inositol 2-dehydrogenase (NADP(+)) n=1 Tax=Pontiella desulfatans TaxID=2750659 RepID=A0A6C2UC25_PONDE|nr:Gfo/Idh/MocA family oxidoreductase [Pontiella desulfatans]VGO17650.1 scyllo-inositol 2-dehydrogenase (NADP(+)) [Pontiella desulfatans]
MKEVCTRRNSLKTTAIAGTVAGLAGMANAAPGKKVKVALVGCGGRGKGDLGNFLKACKTLGLESEVVALADAFEEAVLGHGKHFKVPADRCFAGYDAYHQVAASDAEFVLLVTPPLFRPLHLEAMLKAGKHVFIEKPIAVDAPGCRKVLELGEYAKGKGLGISAGMQRRHSAKYLKNQALVEAGAVGEILGGIVSWNGTVPWIKERRPGDSDADYLARNWLNWIETGGDHIVEQHVHNLDVANWFIGHTPKSAVGFGGRARRESGNSFDFFSVDLDYGNNVHIHSQCRQVSGCFNRVGEELRGSKGYVLGGGKLSGDDSISVPEPQVDSDNDGEQEMIDMIRGVRSGKPLNEAQIVAEATGTAIMGRIACYTGQKILWSDLFLNPKSEWYAFTHGIAAEDFEKGAVKLPPENVVPVPGDGKPIRRR